MSERPRIAVFAYSEVGYVCLEQLLADGANVVLVFTHPDDPEENIWFHSVAALARQAKIPLYCQEKLDGEALCALRSARPELIFSFYYRAMIPRAALELPRLGAYNLHGALLPKYRGRACINWAVLNGETETGATLHVMTDRADRGDIVDAEKVTIDFEDTGGAVFMKVAEAARRIVARSLRPLERGTAALTPQDETQATKFGRRRPADGMLDWNKSALALYHLARSVTHPFPGAFTFCGGRKLFIWKCRPRQGSGIPGRIVSQTPLCVGTGDGLLELLQLQFMGQKEADAAAIAPELPIGTICNSIELNREDMNE